ncbi:hypothetical protein ACVWZZ_006665 [Bradyrhizobium sp. LM6.10]
MPRLIARLVRWTISNLLQSHYDQLFKNGRLEDLRQSGVPEVYFNCTSLTSGSACCFGPTGFTRFNTDGEADLITSDEMRVSFAVAASSAFPPLFPPIEISYQTLVSSQGEFPNPHYLSDGGVYDNLGINPWIWSNTDGSKVFDKLIVSIAEGYFDSEYDKSYTWLVSRNVRASDLLMTRVSELQLGALKSETSALVFSIKDVLDEQVSADGRTDHPISVERQRTLSKIRTDLDMFSSYEVTALIAHGFSVARRSLIDHGLIPEDAPKHSWDPLNKLKELENGENSLTRTLRKGSRRKWRVLSIRDPASLLLAATMALFGTDIFYAVEAYQIYVQDARSQAAILVANLADRKLNNLKLTASDTRTTIRSFQVCVGEFAENCPVGAKVLPCGTSVQKWAKSQCLNASITQISDRAGNRCGYSISQIFCTEEKDR